MRCLLPPTTALWISLPRPTVLTARYDKPSTKPYTVDTVVGDTVSDRALEEAPTLRGDVNNDGNVTVADVRVVLRSTVNKVTLTEAQKDAADVNDDNDVTVADVRKILRYTVGKVTQL